MPGLAEGHGHVRSETDFPLFLAFGVTFVRNMEGTPLHLRLRDAVATGELQGPTVDSVGPGLDTISSPVDTMIPGFDPVISTGLDHVFPASSE